MKIIEKTIKNSNITIVADKLYTGFLSPTFFSDIIPTPPENVVVTPLFGLIAFKECNFMIDVNNRRVIITHTLGSITESFIYKMATKFINEIKPQLIAVGFNYAIDLVGDSEFLNYSKENFLKEECVQKIDKGLVGIGIKAFIKKEPYKITLTIEPNISEPLHAIATANFSLEENISEINLENDYINKYKEFEESINGVFGQIK